MSVIKLKEFLGDVFEIKNGIAGLQRDLMFELIKLIHFRRDELVQNLIGISSESVLWLNHFFFLVCRNPKPDLKRKTLSNQELRNRKLIKINTTSIVFEMNETGKDGSIFLNIIIKEMILECTTKIEFKKLPWINIGVCTPSQLNKLLIGCIGDSSYGGASLLFSYRYSSYIKCNGKYSCSFKEEKIIIIIVSFF